MTTFITGVAGFIGFHVARTLLLRGKKVVGVDNVNDYYAVSLKEDRINELKKFSNFKFFRMDICDHKRLYKLCKSINVQQIIHLAAQVGVRYSVENPWAYIKSNIEGHLSILEISRHLDSLEKLVYASSSSVYGKNSVPFSVNDRVDDPISLYAATKKSDELMTSAYAGLFNINAIGLRFFTVYGPWGRPDMAAFKFTKAVLEGKPVDLYNQGNMKRDFTYVDDIIDGIMATLDMNFKGHKVYNLGNNKAEELMYFLSLIEKITGQKAIINKLPMQNGDMLETYADITDAQHDFGFMPKTNVEEGLTKFITWYKEYYK